MSTVGKLTWPSGHIAATGEQATRAAGQAISTADGQIAATGAVHGFTVATRDTAPFIAAGVSLVNPSEEVGDQGAKP